MQSVCRLPEGLRRRSPRRARPGPKAAPQLDQCSLQSPSRRTVTVAVPPAQAPVRRPLPWCQPENRRRGPGPKAIAVVPAAKPTPWCWSMSRLHGPDPKVESVVPVREPTPWFRPEGRPLGASPKTDPLVLARKPSPGCQPGYRPPCADPKAATRETVRRPTPRAVPLASPTRRPKRLCGGAPRHRPEGRGGLRSGPPLPAPRGEHWRPLHPMRIRHEAGPAVEPLRRIRSGLPSAEATRSTEPLRPERSEITKSPVIPPGG